MYIVLVFVAIVIIGAISLTKHNIEEEKPKQQIIENSDESL